MYRLEKFSTAFKIELILFIIHITFIIVTLPMVIAACIFVSVCNETYNGFALAFAIIATICACIQYLPQIYKTYKLKAAGSLSVIGQAIQVPGGMISLVSMILSGNSVTNWITVITILIL
jgi:uncharacterized protein with PQ loop repeat